MSIRFDPRQTRRFSGSREGGRHQPSMAHPRRECADLPWHPTPALGLRALGLSGAHGSADGASSSLVGLRHADPRNGTHNASPKKDRACKLTPHLISLPTMAHHRRERRRRGLQGEEPPEA